MKKVFLSIVLVASLFTMSVGFTQKEVPTKQTEKLFVVSTNLP